MKSPDKPIKTLICTTDDWFIISHFKPLLQSIKTVSDDVNVVARYKQHEDAIKNFGVRTTPLNFKRRGFNPIRAFITFYRLLRLLYRERPDIVHLIAMKPIVLGGLAYCLSPAKSVVIHLTGLGLLGTSRSWKVQTIHKMVIWFIARLASLKSAWLLIENSDDQAYLESYGARLDKRLTLLGGAGVDPSMYPAELNTNHNANNYQSPLPVVTFIGRMVWSKGVDVLIEAHKILHERGIAFQLNLCGDRDDGNPTAIDLQTLENWNAHPNCSWIGRVKASDIPLIWHSSDIAVVPSRGGEGLPRTLLEAAACSRPVIVTNVPGCRHFVRDGIEGIIIPPEDAQALANALETLLKDENLSQQMGKAARERVLAGFTENHVKQKIMEAYQSVIDTHVKA